MFSGIIEEKATVIDLQRRSEGAVLSIESRLDHSESSVGDSVAVDGVCLTLVRKEGEGRLCFDVSQETIRRSTVGSLCPGMKVNTERSLKLGGRIHGHLVYGHVDSVVALRGRKAQGDSLRLEWDLPPALKEFIVEKGSVALAGVSLTVGEVTCAQFSVYAIPHTLELTTLADLAVGGAVNLEVDMLGRYVKSVLQGGSCKNNDTALTELLREHGFIDDAVRRD